MDSSPSARGLSLPTKILLGLLVGAATGVALNLAYAPPLGGAPTAAWQSVLWWADGVVKPFGDLFLSLLFMVVVPIVFSSLFLGVAGLGSVQKLGSLGGRTLLWFLATTTFAVLLGITLVAVFEPGKAVSPEVAEQIKQQYLGDAQARIAQGAQAKGWMQMLVDIVPRNVVGAAADNGKVLGLIFFALILGAASIRTAPERTRVLRELLESIYELCVRVLGWVMQLAPFGVACLIFHATAKLGIDVMKLVGFYFLTAMGGLVVYQLVVITLLAKVFAGLSPGRFYRGCRTLIVTAFSTSSSNATMPTTIRTATDEFGVPKEIAGFVMPLGATMNMNGTALFEGVSVLFLAQVYGADLSLGQQLLVVGMAVLTAIGAAGVPGGSLPLLAVVLTQVGVPAELLALILGVDRLVDMTRTIPNVTSDLVCSLWLARREGHVLKA
ncbi:MAG: dicarboxylate/amino acid:cation symporter [Planctomycetes bacterium]|jgi:DAACS family dicarboxylate/amino acid:cation (Na+ or H+) symporter|nr:dicarboxylate/amino acid:cation symporter [Planctomycetota bacterium]